MADPIRRPTERELEEARVFLIEFWEERYAELRPASELETLLIAEAKQLRGYLVDEGTRTFCILVVSFMEDALRRVFAQSWSIHGRAEENSYFGSNGPLSTFSQRLAVAKGVGWLNDELVQQAHILRKIRNEFAHNHKVHNFDHEPLLSFAESLKPGERAWYQDSMDLYRAAYDRASRETLLRIRVYCASMAVVATALTSSKLLTDGLPGSFRPSGAGATKLTEVQEAFTDNMIIFAFLSLGITQSSSATK